ncbi:amino-acid acetyltransferase, mitochondrial [Monosporozyma servazzii]
MVLIPTIPVITRSWGIQHQPMARSMFKRNISSRNLILSVLNSTTTKREAKDYLTKYTDEPKIINHSLLLIRNLCNHTPQTFKQLSATISRLRILGLRPICVIPPSKDVEKEAEALDRLITKAKLQPIHLKESLVKNSAGHYTSILASKNLNLFDNYIPNLVPIIKPYVFNETDATEYMSTNIVHFMKHLSKNAVPIIDKFFILNSVGGIPSGERNDNSHVFINLSQEYKSLTNALANKISLLAKREPESEDLIDRIEIHLKEEEIVESENITKEHLQDLQIMNVVLSNLLPTATGLITTVESAALSSDTNNPLLYNLLTDRSLISSSLPRFKRFKKCSFEELLEGEEEEEYKDSSMMSKSIERQNYDNAVLATTVVKKGVGIKTFDFKTLNNTNSIGLPLINNIELDKETAEVMKKTTGKIDLIKMKAILDQSFHRSLDLEHYLNRINGKIASIIVIGDYEGIAVLTYEGPKNGQFVYLDKFAVLPHLKGSLGISDIIFNLMFKKFPSEVVWRSRKDNVVNKWYFQRSVAVIDLSIDIGNNSQKDSVFKLFYYGDPKAAENNINSFSRLQEFTKYVRDIKPSWHR